MKSIKFKLEITKADIDKDGSPATAVAEALQRVGGLENLKFGVNANHVSIGVEKYKIPDNLSSWMIACLKKRSRTQPFSNIVSLELDKC